MAAGLINANPVVYERKERRGRNATTVIDEYEEEQIDQLEIFDILCVFFHIFNQLVLLSCYLSFRDIMDPELPQSLEELKVVTEDSIEVDDEQSYVRVSFTPTNGHCDQISVIGLCIRIKLIRSLPSRYKIDIRVSPGTHNDEAAENKRFNDKDLVAAVMERPGVLELVDYYLEPTFA